MNIRGRAALDVKGFWFDLAELADDETMSDPMIAIAHYGDLHNLARQAGRSTAGGALRYEDLYPPAPRPSQIFAVGLNYADHATESGLNVPPAPLTFTKFPSSICGPSATIPLSGASVDWEVEIVAVIGKQCFQVPADRAWEVVAGLTLGQDISDRKVQMTGAPPQFSLGKSFPFYSPIGPAIVSPDSFEDRDDIHLWCEVSGERMQDSRSSYLIFSVPKLVAYLSSICTLSPGDLIFTGTPQGVGMAKDQYLVEGDEIVSGADGIGELRNICVSGTGPVPLSPGGPFS